CTFFTHLSFSLTSHATLRVLHSFPTRRSSDLSRSKWCSHHRYALAPTTRRPSRAPIALASRARSRWAYHRRSSGLRSSRAAGRRSEEHTSELQSRENLVCRLLLEKKNYLHTII